MILAEITKDNKIQINDLQNPVGDGVLFETIKFTFPLSWNGYSKTAVFKTEDKTVNIVMSHENEMCLSDSECYIPHEVLEGEEFELTVFGVKGDSIATAEKINIRVLESGFSLGDAPLNPTPSEYQQIINLTQTAVDIAQSVRNDADAGLFDGESGADIKIDQIYNPKSENAQSGVALASALENCLTADCSTEWVFDGGNASVDINFIIDDEISDTSSNAIANRAVKEYVDNNIETVAKEYLNNIKTAVSECVAEDLNAVNERITGIVNRVEAEADYIVEQGTEGIWTYRKWASGIAECWGIYNFSGNIERATNSNRYVGDVFSVNFPEDLFKTVPHIFVSPRFGRVSFEIIRNQWSYANSSNSGNYLICTGQTVKKEDAEEAPFTVDFEAIGRWKEV